VVDVSRLLEHFLLHGSVPAELLDRKQPPSDLITIPPCHGCRVSGDACNLHRKRVCPVPGCGGAEPAGCWIGQVEKIGVSWGWRWTHRDGLEILTRKSHPFMLEALPTPQKQLRGHPHAPAGWRRG
jgi:hypothetical protein